MSASRQPKSQAGWDRLRGQFGTQDVQVVFQDQCGRPILTQTFTADCFQLIMKRAAERGESLQDYVGRAFQEMTDLLLKKISEPKRRRPKKSQESKREVEMVCNAGIFLTHSCVRALMFLNKRCFYRRRGDLASRSMRNIVVAALAYPEWVLGLFEAIQTYCDHEGIDWNSHLMGRIEANPRYRRTRIPKGIKFRAVER